MMEAELIRSLKETTDDTKRLYKVSGDTIPYATIDWDGDTDNLKETDYFIVSRVVLSISKDWETMIFPANEEGEVLDWMDLWCERNWEPIQDTVNKFVDQRNQANERLQDCEDNLAGC